LYLALGLKSFEMRIVIPISIAELYDKISILEIKKEKIKDVNKLTNIINELEQLTDIGKTCLISASLYQQLKSINLVIWELEEKIRKGGNFDKLARHIYLSNDKRSGLKKKINLKYKSDIVEEKSY